MSPLYLTPSKTVQDLLNCQYISYNREFSEI